MGRSQSGSDDSRLLLVSKALAPRRARLRVCLYVPLDCDGMHILNVDQSASEFIVRYRISAIISFQSRRVSFTC